MSQTSEIQPISREHPDGTAGKIQSLDALSEIITREQSNGRRVVHCHGVFDLLHLGHIRHFEQARTFGDVLVVTLTPDRYVNKGAHRPAFPERLRAETIAALSVVDYVAVNAWSTAVETLHRLRPDVYCKGSEYRQNQVDAQSNMLPEVAAAEELGIRMAYTEDMVFSSSRLLNLHFSPFPPETDAWLNAFRQRYTPDEIVAHLDRLRDLRVLVVGEAIIDEYVFVNAIGKSTKDPVLACRHVSDEAFAGGSLAVANHLADFCDDVRLITCLGESNRREDYIRDILHPDIQPLFLTKQGAPTIVKRRFVDTYSQNKLFELYVMDDQPLHGECERSLVDALDDVLADYDVVIAADYGHGMLTPLAIQALCDKGRFLAVNTQSNAGNRGFNSISRYRQADYVCLANNEILMETRMRDEPLRDLLQEVARRIDCSRFTVTRGKFGSLHYAKEAGFIEAPSLATQVTDRVGAGDAMLALTSPLVAQGVPWDIVGFIGNVAGAQMVTELGNRQPIEKISLCKYIISLLK